MSDPNDPSDAAWSYVLAAREHEKAQDFAGAISAYEAALAQYKDLGDLYVSDQARCHRSIAQALHRMNNTPASIHALEEALLLLAGPTDLDGLRAELHTDLASFALLERDLELAEYQLSLAMHLSEGTDRPWVHGHIAFHRAGLAELKGDFASQITHLLQALSVLEDTSNAQSWRVSLYRQLGQAYRAHGELTQARAATQASLRLALSLADLTTDDSGSELARAYLAVANADFACADFLAARTNLESALSLCTSPDDDATRVLILNELGATLMNLDDLPNARRYLDQALDLKIKLGAPLVSQAQTYLLLGDLHRQQRRFKAARSVLEHALATTRRSDGALGLPQAAHKCAEIYWIVGRVREAERLYAEADAAYLKTGDVDGVLKMSHSRASMRLHQSKALPPSAEVQGYLADALSHTLRATLYADARRFRITNETDRLAWGMAVFEPYFALCQQVCAAVGDPDVVAAALQVAHLDPVLRAAIGTSNADALSGSAIDIILIEAASPPTKDNEADSPTGATD